MCEIFKIFSTLLDGCQYVCAKDDLHNKKVNSINAFALSLTFIIFDSIKIQDSECIEGQQICMEELY